jgi:uncharacterized protein (DUF427 family)
MKIPGPDHPIAMAVNPKRVRARINGHVIADSIDVLVMKEANYPPVQYFPRTDVETGFLSQSALITECPYKGSATHYALDIDGGVIEKAAWSYEQPYPAVEAIKDRIAFYVGEIEVYEVDEEALKHHHRA